MCVCVRVWRGEIYISSEPRPRRDAGWLGREARGVGIRDAEQEAVCGVCGVCVGSLVLEERRVSSRRISLSSSRISLSSRPGAWAGGFGPDDSSESYTSTPRPAGRDLSRDEGSDVPRMPNAAAEGGRYDAFRPALTAPYGPEQYIQYSTYSSFQANPQCTLTSPQRANRIDGLGRLLGGGDRRGRGWRRSDCHDGRVGRWVKR